VFLLSKDEDREWESEGFQLLALPLDPGIWGSRDKVVLSSEPWVPILPLSCLCKKPVPLRELPVSRQD
jgi:hypothetical protein